MLGSHRLNPIIEIWHLATEYTCAKHSHKRWSSDKAIAKIKRCSFFASQCIYQSALSDRHLFSQMDYFSNVFMVPRGLMFFNTANGPRSSADWGSRPEAESSVDGRRWASRLACQRWNRGARNVQLGFLDLPSYQYAFIAAAVARGVGDSLLFNRPRFGFLCHAQWCLFGGKREDYQNYSVLYCVLKLCTVVSTLRWAVLRVMGYVMLGPFHCA